MFQPIHAVSFMGRTCCWWHWRWMNRKSSVLVCPISVMLFSRPIFSSCHYQHYEKIKLQLLAIVALDLTWNVFLFCCKNGRSLLCMPGTRDDIPNHHESKYYGTFRGILSTGLNLNDKWRWQLRLGLNKWGKVLKANTVYSQSVENKNNKNDATIVETVSNNDNNNNNNKQLNGCKGKALTKPMICNLYISTYSTFCNLRYSEDIK
jgi:hypothetical protein